MRPAPHARGLVALGWITLLLQLGACSTQVPRPTPQTNAGRYALQKDEPPKAHEVPDDVASVPDAVPRAEPRSRGGNAPVYEVFGKTYRVLDDATGFRERGYASWYGKKFHGHKTANGERYDMFAMTAAHKALPLPTYVRVTRTDNGRSVIVRVNDRGPFHKGRIIDLSYAAAAKLDMLQAGQAMVEIEALSPVDPPTPAPVTAEPAIAGSGPGWLQLAAYADPINAVSMRESLASRGFGNAQILVTDEAGTIVHRVVIGPFADPGEAQQIRDSLRMQGLETVWLHQSTVSVALD